MTNTKIFLGGVPTEPDVTALNEAFPVSELLPGKFIEYSQISAVINVSPRSSRFKTVLDRWRINSGLTPRDVAKEVGMSPSEVSEIENGIIKPTMEQKRKLDRYRRRDAA